VVFLGDASMAPYEVVMSGGSVEHWNEEPGAVWLQRIIRQFPNCVWLNPVEEHYWPYTQSIQMIRQIFENRMFPLTLSGLDAAMKTLSH